MTLRHGLDDRQPQAERAAAVAGAAHEALEQGGDELGGNAGTFVLHDERRPPLARVGADADAGAGRGVAQRVLDQVDREPVQLVARGLDHGGVDVQHDLVLL